MSLPVLIRPDALEDIRVCHDGYELLQKYLGSLFVDKVQEVLERIEETPFLYAVVWENVRAARVRKFPYIVYYVAKDERVEVIAVLHGSLDEPEWRKRT